MSLFPKPGNTSHPPSAPTLVYDGDCGFCKFWMLRWKQHSHSSIRYKPYQEVAYNFADISITSFRNASHLIDIDGSIYSGPNSAYRIYYLSNRKKFLFYWYENNAVFRWISDQGYYIISTNRSLMLKLTHRFFGKDPRRIALTGFAWIILLLSVLLLALIIL